MSRILRAERNRARVAEHRAAYRALSAAVAAGLSRYFAVFRELAGHLRRSLETGRSVLNSLPSDFAEASPDMPAGSERP